MVFGEPHFVAPLIFKMHLHIDEFCTQHLQTHDIHTEIQLYICCSSMFELSWDLVSPPIPNQPPFPFSVWARFSLLRKRDSQSFTKSSDGWKWLTLTACLYIFHLGTLAHPYPTGLPTARLWPFPLPKKPRIPKALLCIHMNIRSRSLTLSGNRAYLSCNAFLKVLM